MGKRKRKHGDMDRREFLYVALGSATALFGVSACGVTAWALSSPRARYGVDLFSVDLQKLPLPDERPLEVPEGNFFLTNTSDGVRALCRTCPHLGAILKWVDTNHRFECPSHGRKHTLSGEYIEGPGTSLGEYQSMGFSNIIERLGSRQIGMFQFNVEVQTPSETHRTDNHPIPLSPQDATSITVDIRKQILNAVLEKE